MLENDVYEQYGLQANPFRIQKTIDDIESFHVSLPVDETISKLLDSVIEKKQKQVIFLHGVEGMGKTQRILFFYKMMQQKQVMCHLIRCDESMKFGMSALLQKMLPKGSVFLSNDKWQRMVAKAKKQVNNEQYDPYGIGASIADVLNLQRPSFLMIDDFQYMQYWNDIDRFMQSFITVFDLIKSGVCVFIAADSSILPVLKQRYPSFFEKIHSTFELEKLSDDWAEELISKRLSTKRLVSGLDRVFPFHGEAISWMNKKSACNPKRLLQLADISFTAASYQKEIMITEEIASESYSYAVEQGFDPLKQIKVNHPRKSKLLQKDGMHAQRVLLDSVDSSLFSELQSDVLDVNGKSVKTKQLDRMDKQVEENIDTFLDQYDFQGSLSNLKGMSDIPYGFFHTEKNPVRISNHVLFPANNPLYLDKDPLLINASNQPVKTEMVLSDEINQILSTSPSNKFVSQQQEVKENNGKKKKGFSFHLKKRSKAKKEKKKQKDSIKSHSNPLSQKENDIPLDFLPVEKKSKPRFTSNQKLLKKQIQKGKTLSKKKPLSSDITVRITCPDCNKDFSTVLNPSKKNIVCPYCEYVHHL